MKLNSLKIIALTLFLGFAFEASAQTCNLTTLGSCIYNSSVTCRATVPGCTLDNKAGRNVPDIELFATTSCCRYTGKSKNKKATACFKKLEKGLGKSFKTAGPFRNFLKESQRAVSKLRKAGCSTGSTN